MSDLDYLGHLRAESDRFAEVLAQAPAGAPVPTCPEWDTEDLLWHLARVQWFWGTVVREAVPDPSGLEPPKRPGDREGLLGFFRGASAELQRVLADTPPEAPRWTWAAEQTAGFTRRRQAHEAMVHRVDAELAAGADRTGLDPTLALDGVDEALRVIFAGVPAWGHTEPEPGATLRVVATDASASWLVTLGRFTGTDPDGKAHDEDDIVVAETDPDARAAARLEGTAADLDCWLWGRPPLGQVAWSGDPAVMDRFTALVDHGVD